MPNKERETATTAIRQTNRWTLNCRPQLTCLIGESNAQNRAPGHQGTRIESPWEEMFMQAAAVVSAVNSAWQVTDVPQPQPGANQVLVKMHASGICYTDVHLTLGHFPGPFPRILGHEPVGEIVAVAPDVTTRVVGDRVGSAWIHPRAAAANGAGVAAECSVLN